MTGQITIDARLLFGGIGTYTRHLLQGLKESGNGFQVRAITSHQHKADVERLCPQVSVLNVPIYTAREQWRGPRIAAGHDLLHVPHYNAPLFTRIPLVITLHDVIHISDPYYGQTYKSRLCAWPLLNLIARRVKHIITVSEYSKSQIVTRLKVSPNKVTTIYNGVSEEFGRISQSAARVIVADQFGIAHPYLLYVGNLKKHKNIPTLLKAFALCQKSGLSHQLVIVGDDRRERTQLLHQCVDLGIRTMTHFVSGVAEHLMPALYAGADVFVMPSRLEGFGFPLLEAMASGTPAISSSAASLPEIGGRAVLYFHPSDPAQLAELISRVVATDNLRRELIASGRARAQLFGWKECVRKHIAVYQEILNAKMNKGIASNYEDENARCTI